MLRYVIHRICEPAPLCGDVAAAPWDSAQVLSIDNYPWYAGGQKQLTEVRALYDADALYLQFRCRDAYIYARTTELNGPVCEDSCVEFFATADPWSGEGYFNLEINCCGTMLVGFGTGRYGRKRISPELASRIRVATSVPDETKGECETDAEWWAAAAIPFRTLSELIGRTVRPATGDVWKGNFYRCGGKTDPQFACWSPIESPKPDFHRPEFFGELHFA